MEFRKGLQKVALLVFIVLQLTCRRNPTGPQVTPNVQLSMDYVTCTEVWLKLGFADAPGGGDYRITRDGSTVLTGTISGASGILYDTTAQASKSYSYIAYRLVNGEVKQISPTLPVTTLDSTSNNFTWQTFSFGGDVGSCLLRDVTIISDSSIIALGEITLPDTNNPANVYIPYNEVVWNGRDWSLGQILFPLCDPQGNQQALGADPAYAIFPFSAHDMWVASDGAIDHWDGTVFQPYCLTIGYGERGLRKICGYQGDFYVVCSSGFILRYNGSWSSVPSGTTLEFQDVWGVVTSHGSQQILAVACNRFTNDGCAAVQLSGSTANSVSTAGLPSNVSSVWTANGKEWYVCGEGLYRTRSLNSSWQRIGGVGSTYMESMRGNGPNDIFVVGDFGLVKHFNGSTWCDLTQQINIANSVFYAVAQKGNTVVAVGQYTSGIVGQGVGGAALIVVGKRN